MSTNTTSEDVAKGDSINFFDQEQDESCESRWKQNVAFIVLVLTVLAMVFEKKLGVPLFVSAWAGALILIVSGVISENSAMRSIDMKTIMLFEENKIRYNARKEEVYQNIIKEVGFIK
ncbi:Uncharacterised protein [Oligella ureolytica]|uniref:hypothetical protein n=1 Tax=Oligella ureolytica TaxID=90244 RepID=UPI000DFAB6BB|nr:hypothetical protein [Oligella ureolytica]SUA52837.1 Uncharacterised protein [Oligella ureolytica]